ncbi:hypothetical protein FQN50_001660 [Emmonsiellopsis sp. PD_5]|nr:hypothetical protein FQN50_001660 [Emmonsiellopsis sp. PD_5]
MKYHQTPTGQGSSYANIHQQVQTLEAERELQEGKGGFIAQNSGGCADATGDDGQPSRRTMIWPAGGWFLGPPPSPFVSKTLAQKQRRRLPARHDAHTEIQAKPPRTKKGALDRFHSQLTRLTAKLTEESRNRVSYLKDESRNMSSPTGTFICSICSTMACDPPAEDDCAGAKQLSWTHA